MTINTYRFRLQVPGVSIDQIEAEVGVPVSISDYAGGVIVDLDCEGSSATDLIDSLAFRGYEFVEGDPPSDAATQFRLDNDLLSVEQHKTLRQLIHFIDNGPAEGFASGAYQEVTGTVFPTAIVWWESSSKVKKIVERLIAWTGANATTDKWKIYAVDGVTVLWTVTDIISYSGIFETSRTRAIVSGDV